MMLRAGWTSARTLQRLARREAETVFPVRLPLGLSWSLQPHPCAPPVRLPGPSKLRSCSQTNLPHPT